MIHKFVTELYKVKTLQRKLARTSFSIMSDTAKKFITFERTYKSNMIPLETYK